MPLLKKSLSALFRTSVGMRNFVYKRGWATQTQLPVMVVSVGNIAVGGTGKTPFVQMLVEALETEGPIAILSRGYRSQIERTGRIAKISDGTGPQCSVRACGDEPYFLAKTTHAQVWVGPNRLASGYSAIQHGARCLLLDDGMQHRRLARDVEIVLIDGEDPLSGGEFLPAGKLRDFPARLAEAHFIAINHVRDASHFQGIVDSLKKYTSAPCIGMRPELEVPNQIIGGKCSVFCGIARPERFVQGLEALGVEVVDTLVLPDHRSPSRQALSRFATRCAANGVECLLCTEKDAVKLLADISVALPIIPVKMRLRIVQGHAHWEQLLNNVKNGMEWNGSRH